MASTSMKTLPRVMKATRSLVYTVPRSPPRPLRNQIQPCLRSMRRPYATESSASPGAGSSSMPPPDPSMSKGIPTVYIFGGALGAGLLVTIYSLLEWYYALDTWPEPVRTPLKSAIKAKNRGEPSRAAEYFTKAIEAALSIPSTALDPDPLLKLSGIYIAYAALLEAEGQVVQAYEQLRTGLELFGSDPFAAEVRARRSGPWSQGKILTEEDHLRAIGLSQKLGQLALQISSMTVLSRFPALPHAEADGPRTWDQAAEYHLSSALTAMLRIGLPSSDIKSSAPAPVVVVGKDVNLASKGEDQDGRVNVKGLGMTMESLAEVYARRGEYALAGQLLIQAVSTLLPPQSEKLPPVPDRCQAALMMTTISSHALQPRTAQSIKSAKSWSLRALQVADQAIADSGSSSPKDALIAVCSRARSVGLYNMGMLAEMQGDLPEALKYFSDALIQSKETGFPEGRRQATEAVRRLRNASS